MLCKLSFKYITKQYDNKKGKNKINSFIRQGFVLNSVADILTDIQIEYTQNNKG